MSTKSMSDDKLVERIESIVRNYDSRTEYMSAASRLLELFYSQFTQLQSELEAEQAKVAKLREALKVVDHADRSRGYPTGLEWQQILRVIKNAIKESGDE